MNMIRQNGNQIGAIILAAFLGTPAVTAGQSAAKIGAPQAVATPTGGPSSGGAAPAVSNDYIIGPTDVLSIQFWGEKDNADVVVRPDGKVSLPLLNDVVVAGLTPDQLRQKLTEDAKKFIDAPVVTVVVRQVNNNKAFITGQVQHPGGFALTGTTTVLHLIAMAGGFLEYADSKHITIMRTERGQAVSYEFNYADVMKRKNIAQNIVLKPGDTIIVP